MKIVIWTGPAWETWGPHSIREGGIGGSETAAIHVSRELARLGHEIEIIGQVKPGAFEGVTYFAFGERVDQPIECDVFVSSRTLSARRLLNVKSRLSVLWLHDVHAGDDYQGDLNHYDLVYCVSPWAASFVKNYYTHLSPEKVVITRNGIDTSLFQGPMDFHRKPKFIYSSSPDRGLMRLLDFWPDIKAFCPEAELDVYYGFDTWDRIVQARGNSQSRMSLEFLRARVESMSEQGVTYHGRVNQAELAQAFMASALWAYPTNFTETSCITAMEAQAAGVWPVATKLAALVDTVQFGRLVEPPNTSEVYKISFLSHVRELLADWKPNHYGRRWALDSLSWEGVAAQWESNFSERMASKNNL